MDKLTKLTTPTNISQIKKTNELVDKVNALVDQVITDAERTKLKNIADGANKITVDASLSSTSTNPVQNKAVNTALSNKLDKTATAVKASKLALSNATADSSRFVIFQDNNQNTSELTANYNANFKYNPVSDNLTVGKINGYTINSSVPKNAKFTDTVYSLPDATTSVKGGVKVGSNLTVSSGTLSLTKANVTSALGYTPPTTNTTYSAGTGISLSGNTINNSGVRTVTAGSSANQISVNTNGSSSTITVNNVANASLANSAKKLETSRTISLGTGVTGSATDFDGSSNITIPVTSIKESYLEWGGRSFAGSYGPIDAAMVPELGANRFAFGKADGITVQYSTDGGATWVDYGLSNTQKVALFSTGNVSCTIGKASTSTITAKCMLRVSIDTDKFNVCTALNKFVIYVSTNGSSGCYCTIDASLESTPTIFKSFVNKADISGWSGYNVINSPEFITYGNSKNSQYGIIRFTFGCTGVNNTYSGLGIYKIMGFGGQGWTTPSDLAKKGTIYGYDENQNVTFPAKVAATSFVGDASSVNGIIPEWSGSLSYGNTDWICAWQSDGKKIKALAKSVFAASGHTHNYAASSSAGGAATSANKLNTNAGSATQPAYFSNGIPVACTYTIGKSVPSDAKFTDTNTTYSAGTGLSLSGTTFSNSGVRSVATGSAKNIISVNTGGTTTNLTIDNVANATKATKLKIDQGTADADRYIIFQDSSQSTSDLNACYNNNIKYNPVSNVLTVGSVKSANVVKNLSINGKTITVTKGDGSTSTLTTQDTNTTYTSLKNPNPITISLNGSSQGSYDGSTAKSINITPASIGASPSSHTHTHLITLNGAISALSNQSDGWYKWSGTIDDVQGTWILQKMSTLYTATNIEDPRVVLNSNNLTKWYSPYAYWHA